MAERKDEGDANPGLGKQIYVRAPSWRAGFVIYLILGAIVVTGILDFPRSKWGSLAPQVGWIAAAGGLLCLALALRHWWAGRVVLRFFTEGVCREAGARRDTLPYDQAKVMRWNEINVFRRETGDFMRSVHRIALVPRAKDRRTIGGHVETRSRTAPELHNLREIMAKGVALGFLQRSEPKPMVPWVRPLGVAREGVYVGERLVPWVATGDLTIADGLLDLHLGPPVEESIPLRIGQDNFWPGWYLARRWQAMDDLDHPSTSGPATP